MVKLGYIGDNLISKERVLEKYSQEQIFSIVFKEIDLNKKYLNPLREDKKPSCFFKVKNNTLLFCDYSLRERKINNIYLSSLDCFNFIRLYKKLNSFEETLNYIVEWFNNNNNKNEVPNKFNFIKSERSETEKKTIYIKTRDYTKYDKKFWYNRYNISRKQLKEDGVFPVKEYFINNKKFIPNKLTYAYTEFYPEYKLYFPYSKIRFISTVKKDRIGNINNLRNTEKLIITKSYKDFRVLKNYLDYDIIWFQSETIIPNKLNLNNYKKIKIIFDNDKVGKEASRNLKLFLEKNLKSDIENIIVPKVKDPSDLFNFSKKEFIKFIKKIKN